MTRLRALLFFTVLSLCVFAWYHYGSETVVAPGKELTVRPAAENPSEARPSDATPDRAANSPKTRSTSDPIEEVSTSGLLASGRVIDLEGAPVPGATVAAMALNSRAISETVSDSEGRFSIPIPAPSELIQFEAEKSGYMGQPVRMEGDEAVTTASLEIILSPAGIITGTVIAPDGALIAGASVFVLPRPGGGEASHLASTTEDDGSYVYDALPAGEYVLIAAAPGVNTPPPTTGPGAIRVALASGEVKSDLRLIAARSGLEISGRVVDSADTPLQHVLVSAVAVPGQSAVAHAYSNADGLYSVPGLEDRIYQLTAQMPLMSADRKSDIPAGSMGVNFIIHPRGAIEGQVLDSATREPVVEYEIAHRQNQDSASVQFLKYQQLRDPEGRFKLEAVDVGEATIYVKAQDYFEASFSMPPVPPGASTVGNTILLQPGLSIRGVVLSPEGAPLQSAKLFADDGTMVAYRDSDALAVSDEIGEFILRRLEDSAYTLVANHDDYASGTVTAHAGPDAFVTIRLGNGGTVEGFVLSGDKPEKGAAILSETTHRYPKSTHTDERGFYQLTGVLPGTVSVRAQLGFFGKPDYRRLVHEVEVGEGSKVQVDFAFPASTTRLEGRVYGVDGNTTTADLVLQIETGSGIERFGSQCGEDGYYQFEKIPSGEGEIAVLFSGLVQRRMAVTLPEGESITQDIYLNSGFSVNCQLQLPDVEFEKVRIVVVPGTHEVARAESSVLNTLMGEAWAMGDSFAGEAVLLSGLEAGTYSVTAWIDTTAFRQAQNPEDRAQLEVRRPITTSIVSLDANNPNPTIELAF